MGGLCLAAEVFDWRRFPAAGPSCASPGSSPPKTRPASASIAATSPTPATDTSAPSSSKPPGPTSTDHTSVPASPPATTARTRRHRARVDRASTAVLPVPQTRRPQKRPLRRRRRRRTRARRLLMGRDDQRHHRRVTTLTALERLAIGAEPLEHPPTRRDTATAEPIPAGNPTTATSAPPTLRYWGTHLRNDALRSQLANTIMAVPQSTTSRRVATTTHDHHHPHRGARSSRHPTSRSFVLTSLRALHLDLGSRRLLNLNHARRTSGSTRQETTPNRPP
jgi:hypothetical protein